MRGQYLCIMITYIKDKMMADTLLCVFRPVYRLLRIVILLVTDSGGMIACSSK